MDNKPTISNMEWGIVIGALFAIDIAQIIIEWLAGWIGIGVILNWLIDLFVGMSLAFYLQWRGQSLANPKRLFGILATLGLEFIPVISEFPLWTLDGIFNMMISKSDKIMSKIPGGSIVKSSIESANMGMKKSGGVINSINNSTAELRRLNQQINSSEE